MKKDEIYSLELLNNELNNHFHFLKYDLTNDYKSLENRNIASFKLVLSVAKNEISIEDYKSFKISFEGLINENSYKCLNCKRGYGIFNYEYAKSIIINSNIPEHRETLDNILAFFPFKDFLIENNLYKHLEIHIKEYCELCIKLRNDFNKKLSYYLNIINIEIGKLELASATGSEQEATPETAKEYHFDPYKSLLKWIEFKEDKDNTKFNLEQLKNTWDETPQLTEKFGKTATLKSYIYALLLDENKKPITTLKQIKKDHLQHLKTE
jgi:hypothetical protein